MELHGNLLKHLLDEFHHPLVVLVGDVDFHAGEFRVVGLVHSFVEEVLGELIDSGEASDDEPLEVELVGDSHVEVDVEGIVVGDERTGCGSSRNALEDRGLDLKAAGFVEIFPHRGNDLRPFDEGVLDVRVDDQVDISLTVTQFRIRECVEDLAVLFLDDREHPQRLAQEGELLGMH